MNTLRLSTVRKVLEIVIFQGLGRFEKVSRFFRNILELLDSYLKSKLYTKSVKKITKKEFSYEKETNGCRYRLYHCS